MSSEISQWEDSAFHDMPEHEYSNTLSSPENYRGGAARRHRIGQRGGGSSSDPDNSCQSSSSPCPDYEEIVHENAVIMKGGNVGDRSRALSGAGLVYNLASEGIFRGKDLSPESDPVTKEKIMRSLVYCIHKVSQTTAILLYAETKLLMWSHLAVSKNSQELINVLDLQ